jgi:xanthine dehydrogenase YagS FAD-binding subunit
MCVALAALDARVRFTGASGERIIPFAEFHRLPGDRPEIDTNLRHDEIILGIELPPEDFAQHCSYLKLRDRASYAFALVSVAAALTLDGGRIAAARLALGGVAHKPWRVPEAEDRLRGRPATRESFAGAAERMLRGARGYEHNVFKIELARRAIVRALEQAVAGAPRGSQP